MASDEATIKRIARETARETYNVFVNEGGLTTVAEQRAHQLAEEGLICENCSRPVAATDSVCGRCGSKRAILGDDAKYKCADCNQPISHPEKTKSCPGCRGAKVTRADPSFEFECLRCGKGVTLEQASCSCGETRAVPRPVRDVVT